MTALTREERLLLAAVHRWARLNKWTADRYADGNRDPLRMSPDRRTNIDWTDGVLTVVSSSSVSAVRVTSVRQAVDVLVALGVLPAQFHSLALPEPLPIVPAGMWRHWKGDVYEVVGSGRDSRDGAMVVLYRSTDPDLRRSLYVRRLDEWHQEARPGVKRFTYLGASTERALADAAEDAVWRASPACPGVRGVPQA